MANSLLAHLYSRIRGSQEDIATISLQYLLSQSIALNEAFTHLIETNFEVKLEEKLQYVCQAVGEEKERPDMAGINASGQEIVLCEMKFYAGLTQNQPVNYLNRLKNNDGKGLLFICPKSRQTSLWAKLKKLCSEFEVVSINGYCIQVNGIRMAITTWSEILDRLRKVASSSAQELLSDIQQLDGYCSQMDTDAFLPFSPEDLTADNAKKAERYYEVVDKTIDLLYADENHITSKKGLKATAYRKGYGRSIYFDEFAITMDYNRDFWKSTNSIETPFWVAIRNKDWDTTDEMQSIINGIPSLKKEVVWYATFIALEPLVDSTLDEICLDLKRQILEYVDLFR